MPPPILAHIHLRKCGGTAFAQVLERHFGPRHVGLYADDVYFAYTVPELERVLRETPDVAAFSSHHVRVFPPALLGRPVAYVTFLRDPIRQFVSHMTHCREHYGEFTPSMLNSLPPDAAQLSLREFARWLLTQEREILFRENYDVDFFTRYNPGPGCRLSRAKAILAGFFFVGITERMPESLRKLRGRAEGRGLEFPSEPLRLVNASTQANNDLEWIHPGDEVGAMLLDSICEDRELYRWALSRQNPPLDTTAHPVRVLIEAIQREGVSGELRAAGMDEAEAWMVLRGIRPANREQIALLWLAGDAEALRSLYPKVSAGGYVVADQYRASERVRDAVDGYRTEWDVREPLIPIGSAGVYWRVAEPVPSLAPHQPVLSQEPALAALLEVYHERPDLEESFPEAGTADFKRLIEWARHAARGDFSDSSAEKLQGHTDWYERNSVENPWPLLDAAQALSTNALPETLRHQRVEPYVMLLALFIIEFGLREIVQDGPCAGALMEAVRYTGGRLHSLEEASEAAGGIDLLSLNSLPLYSKIVADLRACAPHLHDGSWIALPHSISSPGVVKALIETVQATGWKPRLYPFIHHGGLLLVRVSQ